MKAINRNGTIQVYNSTPSQFTGQRKSYITGFNLLSESQQRAEGLFDVVVPDYNSNTQQLGSIYWDSENTTFSYPVEDKEWTETLTEIKEKKISNLNSNLNIALSATDWVYIRQLDRGTAIPQEIQEERNALRVSAMAKETEINNLDSKSEVADYDITL